MNQIKLGQRKQHITVLHNLHTSAITVKMTVLRTVNWEGLLTHLTEINA